MKPSGSRALFEVVHVSPGRLRLKLTGSRRNGELGVAASELRGWREVTEVREVPAASSLVVVFDPGGTSAEQLVDQLVAHRLALPARQRPGPADRSGSGESDIGDALAETISRVDRRVAAATGGAIDLRAAVPIGLVALAAREVVAGRATAAPWYALLWYAFDSFTKLRRR